MQALARLAEAADRSEPEENAYRRLRGVCELIGIQRREPEVRLLVDEAAVFCLYPKTLGYINVGSSAIHERGLRLAVGSEDKSSGIFGGVKDQRPGPRQCIRTDLVRVSHDDRAGNLVDIGLDVERARGREVMKRVASPAVVTISADVAVEVEAVVAHNANGLC